jgi:hypothetical protein
MLSLKKQLVALLLLMAAACGTAWALFHYGGLRWQLPQQSPNLLAAATPVNYSWSEAVERVKEPRSDLSGGIEVPPELRHYSDRHWFLATQVAEVEKYNIPTCQDFVDLAAMIDRGEVVSVPLVTQTYVLYGVGQKADDTEFSRFQDGQSVNLYNETQLREAYQNLEHKRETLQKEVSNAKKEELAKVIAEKALLDQFYGQSNTRQNLFRDYESLQRLAKNFGGRSYDLANPSDRRALKMNMLQSLRPAALKILEQVASSYYQQFNRPLPVSSLVRPEQYQHVLRRINRNAVLIETPPHSTGLAFDIDYRYMSPAEQTFVMAELARLKNAGRIEAIRERSANFHIFAFLNGTRPGNDLIAASVDEASVHVELHHVGDLSGKAKPATSKGGPAKSKTRKHRR